MTTNKLAYTLGALLLGSFTIGQARAVSVTETGTFGSDNQVYQYLLTLPTAQTVDIYTTSYGGGMNLDGTTSAAGGFMPALTLFSATSGQVVDYAPGSPNEMSSGLIHADSTTGLVNDVFLQETLAAGGYIVDLTEDPNIATGEFNTNPQFLFANDPNMTGDICGVSGGTFLETDQAPCVQRNGNFSLNIGTVPEPATFWLALPIIAFGILGRKRLLAKS